jgi:ribosome-binding factor A
MGEAVSTPARPERVGAEIQAAVADLLGRGDLRDPRIGFITVTGVKVSPDLRVARVFWSSLGDDAARRETQAGLDAAKGYVRREVTSRVKLRVSPEVFFVFDGSVQEGDKIDRLLREVKAKEGW